MRFTTTALVISLVTATSSNAFAQEHLEWRQVAASIPLGTKLKIQTLDGKRVTGILLRVDDTSVMVKKNTRQPEAAVTVALDQIANLERDNGGGVNFAKALGIGLGAGAGVILSLFLIAVHLD